MLSLSELLLAIYLYVYSLVSIPNKGLICALLKRDSNARYIQNVCVILKIASAGMPIREVFVRILNIPGRLLNFSNINRFDTTNFYFRNASVKRSMVVIERYIQHSIFRN